MHLARFFLVAIVLSSIMILVSCANEPTNTSPSSSNSSTPAPAGPASPAKPPNYGGVLDRVDCVAISGWVWTSANDNQEIEVEIYADGKSIGTVPAKTPRTDLKNMGSGNHGFGLTTPTALKDSQPHSVTAKIAGTDYEIKAWDKIQPTLNCKPK